MTHENSTRSRRSHGRATLADVAAQAGVSAMTVSRALRQPDSVSTTVAQRIQAALESTGYTPNKSAGLLATGRSQIVAALIPNIANSIFAETIQGLSDALQPQKLELLLAVTSYNSAREEEQLSALLGWAPRALVVTGRKHSDGTLALMRRARDEGIPVLEIWDQTPKAEFLQVGFNHRKAGIAMHDHLVACGYRDLAFVQSNNEADTRAKERCTGFIDAAKKSGTPVQLVVPPHGEPMAAGREVARQLLQQEMPPRAWAFTNDLFAAGAYMEAQSSGIHIPEHLALLGFGDLPIANQLGTGLSTLAVPRYAIGWQSGQAIVAACSGKNAASALVPTELQPRLIVRGTTTNARR